MSVASQLSFGNAAVLTSGTLPGDRGVTASDNSSSFIAYNGSNVANGQFNNSTTDPSDTTRLNFNGNLHATNLTATTGIIGPVKPRVVIITDATSVTMNADVTDIASQINTQVIGVLTINAATGSLFDGQKIIFRIQSTNIQEFAWNSAFVGSADLALPTVSTGSDKYDYMGFIYNSSTSKWHLLAKNFGF
jgi:hypothetical protein